MMMIDGAEDAEVEGVVWRRLLVWFSRVLALGLLASGLLAWMSLIGLDLFPKRSFFDLSLAQRGAMVALAVADLVAAVGLWLLSAWGSAVWLGTALSRIALGTVFARTFGPRPFEVLLVAVVALAHIALIVLAWRQERAMR